MPWYCGHCGRWNPRRYRVCPTCRRPESGRLCLGCRGSVPPEAVCCPACAGVRLTDPGSSRPVWGLLLRLSLLAGCALFLGPVVRLLRPGLLALEAWAMGLAWQVGTFGLAFWLLSGLLPAPLRQGVRRAGRGAVRWAARSLGALFR